MSNETQVEAENSHSKQESSQERVKPLTRAVIKRFLKQKRFSSSPEFYECLEAELMRIIERSCSRARENGRKRLMSRDI